MSPFALPVSLRCHPSAVRHQMPGPSDLPEPPAPHPPDPATFQPRDYQALALDEIKRGNAIVHLPTGTGKTHIAVLAIDHFLAASPGRAVAFIVPTRNLVLQQASYCRQHCRAQPRPRVVELDAACAADRAAWANLRREPIVAVGTPEAFRRAMVDSTQLPVSALCLLVVDECHNAVGASAMGQLLRHVVAHAPDARPRIVGLTASFMNGANKDPGDERARLEALLDARILCPQGRQARTGQSLIRVPVDPEETVEAIVPLVRGSVSGVRCSTRVCAPAPCSVLCFSGCALLSSALLVPGPRVPRLRTHVATPPPPCYTEALCNAMSFAAYSHCASRTLGSLRAWQSPTASPGFRFSSSLTTCQIRYHSHLWDHRSTGQP